MNDSKIENDSGNVALLTGNGLKYVQSVISIPEAVEPGVESLEKLMILK